MLNVFNGIIVDTFQEIRMYKESKQKFDDNQCYICGLSKLDFEKKGKSYENHLKNVHGLMDYFYYFIQMHEKSEFDLNSNESEVQDCIHQNDTMFFPLARSSDLNN